MTYQTSQSTSEESKDIARQRCGPDQHQPQVATQVFLNFLEDKLVPDAIPTIDAPEGEEVGLINNITSKAFFLYILFYLLSQHSWLGRFNLDLHARCLGYDSRVMGQKIYFAAGFYGAQSAS